MTKRTIHFVYTVPLGRGIFRRGIDKVFKIFHLTPLHRYGIDFLIPWQHPIRAPHSISYHLLKALKQKGKVRFYNMYEKGKITLGPHDIFIGQPAPAGGFSYEGRPDHDDFDSITSQTLRAYKGSVHKKILIMPFANDPLLVSWAKDLAENYADKIILIGGDIWTKNWKDTPFGSIDEKKVFRVDMGIDMKDYPLVKKNFNSKGKRGYLYIGHNAWYKNTKELEKIAERMPGYRFTHIGGAEVKGWNKLANFAALTPEFMSSIAKDHDIFVNTSTADAQATTILEEMCFGMVVAATPESGYSHESLVKLDVSDTDSNVKTLLSLQEKDEKELLDIVHKNRETVKEKHSWESFSAKIVRCLEENM